MSGQWHGGKGSKPRRIADKARYESNWDKIFSKGRDIQGSHSANVVPSPRKNNGDLTVKEINSL